MFSLRMSFCETRCIYFSFRPRVTCLITCYMLVVLLLSIYLVHFTNLRTAHGGPNCSVRSVSASSTTNSCSLLSIDDFPQDLPPPHFLYPYSPAFEALEGETASASAAAASAPTFLSLTASNESNALIGTDLSLWTGEESLRRSLLAFRRTKHRLVLPLSSPAAPSRLLTPRQVYHTVVRALEPRPLFRRRGELPSPFTGSPDSDVSDAVVSLARPPPPRSNDILCADSPQVEEFGTKCKLIARSLGGRLGCEKKLIDIAPDGMIPANIPSFASVADACPDSCGLCETCAPNCALWFIGNKLCDIDCNVPQCQFDGGDCWSLDCVLSEWSDWNECSVTCGGRNRPGLQKRQRRIKSHPKNRGRPCQKTSDTRDCYRDDCPSDCLVSEWSEWSDCSATCGEGQATRTRSVLRDPDVNGAKCPPRTQTRRCLFDSCASDCQVGEWRQWTACTATCDGGAQVRRREVVALPLNDGAECPSLEESQTCNDFSCSSNCVVDDWTGWSDCSATCGGGGRIRERSVVKSNSMYEGCPSLLQEEVCNDHDCAADCVPGPWGNWTPCSASCGMGVRSRNRDIKTPRQGAGVDCQNREMTVECFAEPCATDCQLSNWSDWSECSGDCGIGTRRRSRTPEVFASSGGRGCDRIEEIQDCKIPCAVGCMIGEWGEWSDCREMCQEHKNILEETDLPHLSIRNRPITLWSPECPDASNLMQKLSCETLGINCDADCVVSPWIEWSGCSASCGGGTRNRQRLVETKRSGSGHACPELSQLQQCGTVACDEVLEGQSVDCQLGEWSVWSECDQTCGGGKKVSTRPIVAFGSDSGEKWRN